MDYEFLTYVYLVELYGDDEHGEIGVEKESMSDARVEDAREGVLASIWDDD